MSFAQPLSRSFEPFFASRVSHALTHAFARARVVGRFARVTWHVTCVIKERDVGRGSSSDS